MTLTKTKYLTLAALVSLGLSPIVFAAAPSANSKDKQPDDDQEEVVDVEEEGEEGEEEEGDDSVAVSEDHPRAGYIDEEIVVTNKNGGEDVIEVPEGMIGDYEEDSVDYNAKTYLHRDSTCMLEDVNPVFEQDVYIDRLKRMPTAMEMPWNEVVQKFIDRYSGRLRHSVSYMLGASNFYMPIFEEALEVYGIPLELKYLPVIESALKPQATSRVGAGGLWQFMIPTARRYGLKVNSMIDERRDPVKSSYAAAHYLYDLYQTFGDWNLVLAAYNYGPANIQKAIQRAGGEKDYWKIYPYLPTETRGYVPGFIAANYIMNYYCEHNICPMVTTLPTQSDTIMIYRNVHFQQIAGVIGISIEQLRSLNPQYRRDVITGYSEPTDLRLPQEYISKFIENEDSIYNYNVDELMKRAVVDVDQTQKFARSTKKYVKSKKTKSVKKKSSKRSRSKSTTKKKRKKSKKSRRR